MINRIIQSSRASFRREPNEEMYSHFDKLVELAFKVHPDIQKPQIKICYSINRLCESFKFQNKNYIIYDQYLGQSFNKLNRILFHESEEECVAYLCKILGEENYILNNIAKAAAYNIFYQLNSKAKVGDLPPDFFDKKQEMIAIQESFVLFHEFAHSIVSKDKNQIKYAEEFMSSNKSSRHLILTVQNHLKKNGKDPDDIRFFFEEIACDFLAVNFTYSFFTAAAPVRHANILESISAGFLHLRTIYDLRNKARGKYFKPGNTFTFFMKLRYNALRSYFSIFPESKEIGGNLIDIYELWEEKFDMNLVLTLTNEFEEKLLKIFRGKKMEVHVIKEMIGVR